MKSFIYKRSDGKPPSNGSGVKKTVVVYRVVKNIPVLVGEYTDTFMDDNQLVMCVIRKNNALPFQHHHKTMARLFNDGVAIFTQV